MRALAWVVLTVGLGLTVAGCSSSSEEMAAPPTAAEPTEQTEPDTTAPARDPAPALAGTALDGSRVALADLRGRPVLINVWSSW